VVRLTDDSEKLQQGLTKLSDLILSVDEIISKDLERCTHGRAAGLASDRMSDSELTITSSEQGLEAVTHW